MVGTPPPGPYWRRIVLLATALVIARGLVWLCVLPPFEGWDEYQHLGYVAHVAETGRRAVLNETHVPESYLKAAVAFPQPGSVVETQLRNAGAVGYGAYWESGGRVAVANPGERVPLYQAQHAPLYYQIVAPLYVALGGAGRVARTVAGLRVLNLLLTAAAAAVAFGVFRRAFRSERAAALACLVLATHPLYLMNGTRVANDALGVFLAAAAVALGMRAIGPEGGGRPLGRAGAFGLVVGLAALAKASNLALLPFAGLVWFLGVVRHKQSPREAALAGIIMAVAFLAVVQGEARFNLGQFGTVTAMQEAVINRREGRSAADLLARATTFDWPTTVRRLWTRELFFQGGWSVLRPFPGAIKTYQLATTVGLVGLAMLLRRGKGGGRSSKAGFVGVSTPLAFGALVLSYSAALAYHTVHSAIAWGQVTTNPWYACPALPWFLALAVGGGLAWGRLGTLIPLGMAAAGVAIEFVAVWGSMLQVYSGGATGWEAVRRIAALRPEWLGTPMLIAAELATLILASALLLTVRDLSRAEGPAWSGNGLRLRARRRRAGRADDATVASQGGASNRVS